MLRLGGEFRLGEALLHLALLHLGGSESSKIQALGSPRNRFLHIGRDLRLGERSYA